MVVRATTDQAGDELPLAKFGRASTRPASAAAGARRPAARGRAGGRLCRAGSRARRASGPGWPAAPGRAARSRWCAARGRPRWWRPRFRHAGRREALGAAGAATPRGSAPDAQLEGAGRTTAARGSGASRPRASDRLAGQPPPIRPGRSSQSPRARASPRSPPWLGAAAALSRCSRRAAGRRLGAWQLAGLAVAALDVVRASGLASAAAPPRARAAVRVRARRRGGRLQHARPPAPGRWRDRPRRPERRLPGLPSPSCRANASRRATYTVVPRRRGEVAFAPAASRIRSARGPVGAARGSSGRRHRHVYPNFARSRATPGWPVTGA